MTLMTMSGKARFYKRKMRVVPLTSSTIRQFGEWGGGTRPTMPESEEAMDENCTKIEKLIDLYRAGKLTESEKADVEYHLLYCPECVFLLTLVPSLSPE